MESSIPKLASSLRPRACENCRRKKKRCDGGKPQCILCMHTNKSCTYPRSLLKPGPKPGKIIANRRSDMLDTRGCRNPIAYTTNTIPGRDLLRSSSSPLSESESSSPTLQTNDADNRLCDMGETPGTHLLDRPTDAGPPADKVSILTSLVPPKHVLSYLVEIFFDLVHPQMRVLHRPSFLLWIESGNFKSDPDSILLILSISALAARFSDRPEVDLFDRTLLNGSSPTQNEQIDSRFKCGKRCQRGKGFLTQANRLFHREALRMEKLELDVGTPQRPTIRFIQAAALLSFAEIAETLSSRAYSLVSATVRLAYDYGLDKIDCNCMQPKFELSDHRAECVKKEELRRAWWAISDMENFICVIKCRPRLIDWDRCKTRLPCDDVDWFEGHEVPSSILPANVYDLRTSLDLPAHISVMGQRILVMHLFAKLAYIAASSDHVDGWHDSVSAIEECIAAWKPTMAQGVESGQTVEPAEGVSNDALIAYLVLQTAEIVICNIRMFKNATPGNLFTYYQDISKERSTMRIPIANHLRHKTPESRAFSKALYTSDVICSTISDQPTDSMAPFFFIAPLLWAPACLQLLVKSSTAAWPELMERASLSLRILTMRMEQCAEFWGLGLFYLASFSQFEKRLTRDPQGEGSPISRHQYFPDFLDAAFLRELSSISYSDDVLIGLSRDGDVEIEQHEGSTNLQNLLMQSNAIPATSNGLLGYMDNFDWMEINWEEMSSWVATESELAAV